MRCAAVEANLHRPRIRCTEDHVADRRSLVVHVPEARLETLVVEGGRTEQAHFLLWREQKLDAAVRPVLGKNPASAFEHRRDGRLVVRAEDRAGGVAHDAVLDHRLDRALGRNGVEMCAEKDGVAAVRRFEAAEHVADVRADFRAGVVFVNGQAEVA